MSGEIVVSGKPEVIAGLDALESAARDMTEPHRAMLSRLVPAVALHTPRRTGALAVSWRGEVSASSASITSPLRYAAPVEFGTARMAGAHMVGDTLASSTDEIEKHYEDHIAEAGKRAGFGVAR